MTIADRQGYNRVEFDLHASSPAWSPDGRSLAVMRGDSELWLIDQASPPLLLAHVPGERFSLEERHGSYASCPVWSSDGRFLTTSLTRTERGPGSGKFRFEHASVLLDLQRKTAATWDGYFTNEAFCPTVK